jgi:predicted peroxiredoxin
VKAALKKMIIQLWRTSVNEPQYIATPLLFASTAAAMDVTVEVHIMGAAIDLFVKGNKNNQQQLPLLNKSPVDLISDAIRIGVKFYPCSGALRDRALVMADLIDGLEDSVGMLTMLERTLSDDVRVLTY